MKGLELDLKNSHFFTEISTETTLTLKPLLFRLASKHIVVVELSSKQKTELRIALLLAFGHVLKLGPISGHKFRQFVDDVP